MTEVKKLKARPEAEPEEVAPVQERMIEVEVIRKYVPAGQPQEIQKTVPPGTVMEFPKDEAARMLKLGIARGTDRTFG